MALSKDLYLEERRQEILGQVNQAGRASVIELSQVLGVSEVTIRADLQALADKKLLIRTHGGAIAIGDNRYDLALTMRRQQQMTQKQQIGEMGATMIADGDAVFFDSSSTVLAIVPHLKQRVQLTVITNSIAVAQEMRDAPGIRVVMPGGTIQRETDSIIGLEGLEILRRYNIQKGFFGAHGISLPEGLTDVSAEEAELKQAIIARCRQTIAVLDATKWGRVGLASFATPNDIDLVITDNAAPSGQINQITKAGIEVILV